MAGAAVVEWQVAVAVWPVDQQVEVLRLRARQEVVVVRRQQQPWHNNLADAALICAPILRTNQTRIRIGRRRRKRTETKVRIYSHRDGFAHSIIALPCFSSPESIKVFDGNLSLRRRIFRVITVPRQCTLDQLLTTALRAFHITRTNSEFYLTDMYAPSGDEVRVQDNTPVLTLTRIEGRRPAVFLRFRDKETDRGHVRVYPGKLQMDIDEAFVRVPVANESNVRDLIRDSLERFRIDTGEYQVDEFRCLEVLLDRGVTERILVENERPWDIMKQLGRDSIRQMETMRFYLQHKQDPHGPNLALFVGNLPPGLSQRNYEHMLTKFVNEDKFSSIGPIYYEYGSVVITYEDAAKAVRAFYTLREAICEGKNLLVLLLPNIEPSMVPTETVPLLVFVNVKSGGCQGLELISSFRKLLNPYQVFDLDNGGPLPG